MSESRLIDHISAADPYGPGTELPVEANRPDVAIVEIRRRINMSSQGNPPTTDAQRSWRGPALALAAFAIVLIFGSIVFFVNDGDPTVDSTVTSSTAATTTSSPVTTTTAPPTTTSEPAVFDSAFEPSQFAGNWEFGGDTWTFIVFGDAGWFNLGIGDSVVGGSLEKLDSQILFNWGPDQPYCEGLVSRFNVDFEGDESFRLVNASGPCDDATEFEGAVFVRTSETPDPGFYEPTAEASAACLAVAEDANAQLESIFDRGDADPSSVDWQTEFTDTFGAMQTGIAENCDPNAAGHVVSEFIVYASEERFSRSDTVIDRINALLPGACMRDMGLTPAAQAVCKAG